MEDCKELKYGLKIHSSFNGCHRNIKIKDSRNKTTKLTTNIISSTEFALTFLEFFESIQIMCLALQVALG